MRRLWNRHWPPARRRRRARLESLRWDFWFHCLAVRNTDEWFARYECLLSEIQDVKATS